MGLNENVLDLIDLDFRTFQSKCKKNINFDPIVKLYKSINFRALI